MFNNNTEAMMAIRDVCHEIDLACVEIQRWYGEDATKLLSDIMDKTGQISSTTRYVKE